MDTKMANKQLDKKEQKKQQVIIHQQVSQIVTSPLPPPEWIERYNAVNPEIIKEILSQYREDSKKGWYFKFLIQWLGFIALMSIFVLTYFCIVYDRTGIAVALLGIGTASVLGVFMNRNHTKDNQDKK